MGFYISKEQFYVGGGGGNEVQNLKFNNFTVVKKDPGNVLTYLNINSFQHTCQLLMK